MRNVPAFHLLLGEEIALSTINGASGTGQNDGTCVHLLASQGLDCCYECEKPTNITFTQTLTAK